MDWFKRAREWLVSLTTAQGPSSAETVDLLQQLAGGSRSDRWLAAEALGEGRPGKGQVEALSMVLNDPDPILRWEAATALARLDTPDARQALLAVLASGGLEAQAAALDALGRMPVDEETGQALLAAVGAADAQIRQSAVEALAQQPFPEALPTLLHLLASDPEPMVRRGAAIALGHLGDPAAEAVLSACRGDPREDWRVRQAAAMALPRLRPVEEATD